MLDTAATFLANSQADPQAHSSLPHAWYSCHLSSQLTSWSSSTHFVCLCFIHQPLSSQPHELTLKLSVAVHYLAAGPRSRSRWGAVRVWVPSPPQQAAPPLPGPAAGRGDSCSRCRDRKTRRSTGMSALSCCSSTSQWHLQQMKDGGDKNNSWCRRSFCGERLFYIYFLNKGAVLKPVQKCHNVMVLSQVTLCDV